MEEWKDIKGYEGLYQVSDLGRVKSLGRRVKHWRGGLKTVKEKTLKLCVDSMGYSVISLYKNKIQKTRTVHQLVAIAFLNHIPCGYKGLVVDHRNNVKSDNRLDNLQVTTYMVNNSKDRKGTSKYTGVSWRKERNKWVSHIRIKGKLKHLGLFTDELEASEVYQKALKEITAHT